MLTKGKPPDYYFYILLYECLHIYAFQIPLILCIAQDFFLIMNFDYRLVSLPIIHIPRRDDVLVIKVERIRSIGSVI